MACNDGIKMDDGQEPVAHPNDSCYPTGCTPCTEPIEFPASPIDNQRYCVPIGANGEQKCWVFDKCIPGWRAEGPSASPTRYRGAVNVKSDKPGFENTELPIQAGDWYVQKTDQDKPFMPEWGLQLGDSVSNGDRIAFNGSVWQKLQPPNVPYAEEARDGDKPSPDDRAGGIVKLATVGQVSAGTNKCDAVTPYTLKEGLGGLIPSPENFKLIWEFENTEKYVPIDTKLLSLTVLASAYTGTGDDEVPSLGQWVFKYYDITAGAIGSGDEVLLSPTIVNSQQGGYAYEDSFIQNWEITPVTSSRILKVVATFYDVYGQATEQISPDLTVKYSNAMKITTQPADIDTQPEDKLDVELSTSVVVEPFSAELPFDATKLSYQWLVWNIDISDTNEPDLNYDFSGFNTNTLTAKRTGTGAETVQIRCEILYGDDHPVFDAVIDDSGKLVIINERSTKLSNRARAHDAEVVNDWLLSEPALLKGPTERIIKETTNTVVERETVTIKEVAPKVGSTVQSGAAKGTILYFDKSGNFSGSRSTHVPGVQTVRARRGKPDGSDRRLKKNIMSIGEYYASN